MRFHRRSLPRNDSDYAYRKCQSISPERPALPAAEHEVTVLGTTRYDMLP